MSNDDETVDEASEEIEEKHESIETSSTLDNNTGSAVDEETPEQRQSLVKSDRMSEQAPSAEPHALSELDAKTLVQTVEELQASLKHLKTENTVLQRFLQRNDPAALENMDAHIRQIQERNLSTSTRRSSIVGRTQRRSSVASEASSHSQSLDLSVGVPHEMPKINYSQKIDLVLREMDELQAQWDIEMKRASNVKFNLDARIEEMEIRKAELEESIENLERFKQSSEGITLEKFVRFMEEWSKRSRLMVDKIRLRYSSLKVQYHKITVTLAEKLLIGENLQEIDFEQLRIENLHLTEKIEKIMILLIELKKMTGAGNLKLCQHKKLLQRKIWEKDEIVKAIDLKEREIAKSDIEISKLNKEVEQVKQEFYKIKDLVEHYEAPDILEYITTKARLDNLRRNLKVWTRRKTLKDVAMNTALLEMKRLLGGRLPDPAWFDS